MRGRRMARAANDSGDWWSTPLTAASASIKHARLVHARTDIDADVPSTAAALAATPPRRVCRTQASQP